MLNYTPGRNIIKSSYVGIVTEEYNIKNHPLYSKPDHGDVMSSRTKISFVSERSGLKFYNTNGKLPLFDDPLKSIGGYCCNTFNWRTEYDYGDGVLNSAGGNNYLLLYDYPIDLKSTATYDWIVVAYGSQIPETWYPAPEDIQTTVCELAEDACTI